MGCDYMDNLNFNVLKRNEVLKEKSIFEIAYNENVVEDNFNNQKILDMEEILRIEVLSIIVCILSFSNDNNL